MDLTEKYDNAPVRRRDRLLERERALGYLVEKNSPGFQKTGRKYMERSFQREKQTYSLTG